MTQTPLPLLASSLALLVTGCGGYFGIPRVELDKQCTEHTRDLREHVARPLRPPALQLSGEWGNPKGGPTWVFVQNGPRVQIEIGDLYDDGYGRRRYRVFEVAHGVVDGDALYLSSKGPPEVLGRLELSAPGTLRGVRYMDCHVNRDVKLTRLR